MTAAYEPVSGAPSPADVLARWPEDVPVAALWSAQDASEGAGRWSRWTLIGVPGERTSIDNAETLAKLGRGELAVGGRSARDDSTATSEPVPFAGATLAVLTYELGRELEPAVRVGGPGNAERRDPHGWGLGVLFDFPTAYVHDGRTGRWFCAGRDVASTRALPAWEGLARPSAETSEAREACEALAWSLRMLDAADAHAAQARARSAFVAGVDRVRAYIHAGDAYQVNLAHVLRASVHGARRVLTRAMLERARPWYGAYIEDGPRALVSVSPELLVQVDEHGLAVTRPIKGSRPDVPGARAELSESEKEAAELAMIVDLMRNDLGRVCEPGSVRVPEWRTLERHAGGGDQGDASAILHGVATITGRVRPGLGVAELVRAVFPGGSVTGAPKVRAMQIIEELEPEARGPYCGSVGLMHDDGRVSLNIAIRTASLLDVGRGEIDVRFGVGAGIVSDSVSELEFDETMHKARVLTDLEGTHPR